MSNSLPSDNETCAFGSGHKPEPRPRANGIEAMERVQRLVTASQPDDDSSVDRLTGMRIGRYVIDSLIGQGGMGSVYRARQTSPVQRDVALKIMNLASGSAQRDSRLRFVAEAQLLASMQHNEIACVFDADTTPRGEPYFVMELVDGISLTRYCETHRLTIGNRIRLVQRICKVVHRAHQQGIVHRDLKPDNILVSHGDQGPQIKIIDFGIAKILEGHESIESGLTAQDQFIGTPGYLSPEQAIGSDIDARADVYSRSAILSELVCGSTPINSVDTPCHDMISLRQLTITFEPHRPSARLSSRDRTTRATIASACQTNASRLLQECRSDLDWVVRMAMVHARSDIVSEPDPAC